MKPPKFAGASHHAGAALVGATGWRSNATRRAPARPMGAQTPTLTLTLSEET